MCYSINDRFRQLASLKQQQGDNNGTDINESLHEHSNDVSPSTQTQATTTTTAIQKTTPAPPQPATITQQQQLQQQQQQQHQQQQQQQQQQQPRRKPWDSSIGVTSNQRKSSTTSLQSTQIISKQHPSSINKSAVADGLQLVRLREKLSNTEQELMKVRNELSIAQIENHNLRMESQTQSEQVTKLQRELVALRQSYDKMQQREARVHEREQVVSTQLQQIQLVHETNEQLRKQVTEQRQHIEKV